VFNSDKKGATKQVCYRANYDPVRKSVLFDHDRRHGHVAMQKILSDYQGYRQTDGANMYDSYAKAAEKILAEQALTLLDIVYAVEKHIREEGLTVDDKLAFRQNHTVPALAALHAWMKHQYKGGLRPSSPICGAIKYVLKRWDKMTIYANTHPIDIDNNKVEHAIQPGTIGRKN
jgi:transposase